MHELVVNTEYVLTIRFRPVHTTQRSLKVYVLMLWRRFFVMTDRLLGRVASQSIKLFKIAKLSHSSGYYDHLPNHSVHITSLPPFGAHDFPCTYIPYAL